MEELISKATGQELERFILVIVAMSLLVSPQEPARTMGSGLEMLLLVKVRQYDTLALWSDTVITKKLILITVQCSTLPDPSNGRVSQQGNNPGDRASYTCNSGYELVGQSTRTCQNNGQWSGDAPTCQSKAIRYFSIMIRYRDYKKIDFNHNSTMLHLIRSL